MSTAPTPGTDRGSPSPAGNEDFLGPLLHTLAESLDVREIFARISAVARQIVPHEFLVLGMLAADHRHVQVVALSGELPENTGLAVIPDELRAETESEAFVLNECEAQPGGATFVAWLRPEGGLERRRVEAPLLPMFRPLVARGMISYLRVTLRLRGGVLGALIFCSTEKHAFPPEQVARARLIASCVALALAHQRLSEEEQRSAEARARADLLERRVERLTEELESQGRHRVLGQSKRWREVLAKAGKVAPTETTVLLSGESGTGKEVVARFIHRASARADGPFVALNCAALPEQLLESELFGHEKGAFTGALSARSGRIEQAAGGVLFLDEVGEMSPAVQAKFLRVLQEREYQRVGGARTLRADVRVLAATNRDLPAAIAQGAFREDLYYRLAVFDLVLPPLRERPEDIDTLVDAFVEEIGSSMGRPGGRVSAEAREKLAAYRWPGNVRELRNAIERAVILSEGATVTSEHLPLGVVAAKSSTAPAASPHELARPPRPGMARGALAQASHPTLESAERAMIVDALARAGDNKSKAARLLGLTRAQLRSRLEKHGL
jgi:transcriptional regulator with GAF, ATPase, and Fis domain